jgi:aquaporin Z
MYGKLITEVIGTFVFIAVFIKTGDPLAIGIALAAVIFMGVKVSGGHYNPAVTLTMYANNKLKLGETLGYITSQVLGGLLALKFHQTF